MKPSVSSTSSQHHAFWLASLQIVGLFSVYRFGVEEKNSVSGPCKYLNGPLLFFSRAPGDLGQLSGFAFNYNIIVEIRERRPSWLGETNTFMV